MFRIDGPTAAPNGLFTAGDPNVPTPPTAVSATWLSTVQEELVSVVLAAGIGLDKMNSSQLIAAIRALIASGGISLASDADAITGTSTTEAVTPHSASALVTARINALVNGAPGALDTLKELADAIGDDGNYAGTVTAALAARMLTSWTLTAAGLAQGGGNGAASRTITVPAATGADVAAGTDNTKAITPASLAQGRGLEQDGSIVGTLAPGVYRFDFPTPFPNTCRNVQLTAINLSGSANVDTWCQLQTRDKNGFNYVVQTSQTGGAVNLDGVDWTAKGT